MRKAGLGLTGVILLYNDYDYDKVVDYEGMKAWYAVEAGLSKYMYIKSIT